MKEKQYLESEIELREFCIEIWQKRIFVLSVTIFFTIITLVYVTFKVPTAIYYGKILLEIGEIQSNEFGSKIIDDPEDLSEILGAELKVKTFIPRNTTKLLEIIVENENKEIIKKDLNLAIDLVLARHQQKAKFYENVIMSRVIINEINNEPINKLKKTSLVLIGSLTGFILSIFIIFFIKFIKNIRKDELIK